MVSGDDTKLCLKSLAYCFDHINKQSEVEETIERIKVQSGVEGYVICNKQGQVLRRYPSMTLEQAEKYSNCLLSLTNQARGVVRDLNPKVH